MSRYMVVVFLNSEVFGFPSQIYRRVINLSSAPLDTLCRNTYMQFTFLYKDLSKLCNTSIVSALLKYFLPYVNSYHSEG